MGFETRDESKMAEDAECLLAREEVEQKPARQSGASGKKRERQQRAGRWGWGRVYPVTRVEPVLGAWLGAVDVCSWAPCPLAFSVGWRKLLTVLEEHSWRARVTSEVPVLPSFSSERRSPSS